jgi:hypothetical protein
VKEAREMKASLGERMGAAEEEARAIREMWSTQCRSVERLEREDRAAREGR